MNTPLEVSLCMCVPVCVSTNILFYSFRTQQLFGHFLSKDVHFSWALSLLLYIRFALSFFLSLCVGLPAASVTYLNFTRAYTGKDKRDLYPLMPVICSIKLLYAADTLREDLRASLPYTPCPFSCSFCYCLSLISLATAQIYYRNASAT